MIIEGYFAKLMYRSLYKMHLMALHGLGMVVLDTFSGILTGRTQPRVKLH
jgi:NADH dehydrogenase